MLYVRGLTVPKSIGKGRVLVHNFVPQRNDTAVGVALRSGCHLWLTAIMRHVARFCTSGERARACDPAGGIGVGQLVVRRVWGWSASVGGWLGRAAPRLMGRTA